MMRRQVVGCLTCGATEHITDESIHLKNGRFPMFEPGMMENSLCPVCEAETLWATKDIDNFTTTHLGLFNQGLHELPEDTRGIARIDIQVPASSMWTHRSIPGEIDLHVNIIHSYPDPIRIVVLLP